jgi:mevalonate kinase
MSSGKIVHASAPGKVILFGEHAVVYGRPAIAAPVSQVRATAVIEPHPFARVRLVAADLGTAVWLDEAAADDPLALAVRQTQVAAGLAALPGFTLTVHSDIPIASGLGSGAAVTVAVIRAVATHLGLTGLLTSDSLSTLAYEVEKIHHGTPSGIDNTVVAFEQPVYFVRRTPHNQIETFSVAAPLRLLIGDTGVGSATRAVVGDVRRRWEAEPSRFEELFDGCGRIATAARRAIEQGETTVIGRLMSENHALLVEMSVSSPELERLVAAAQAAGALGAKLSGAGRGGNMVTLVTAATETAVRHALLDAGARQALTTLIQPAPAKQKGQPHG